MKNSLILISAIIFLFSCSKSDLSRSEIPSSARANVISTNDINYYLESIKGIDITKSKSLTRIDPLVSEKDTLMYLINYESGWELLSADKRAPIVIAMSETGNISIDDLNTNPEQKHFWEQWKKGIYNLRHTSNSTAIVPAEDSWENIFAKELDTKGWSEWYYVGEILFSSETQTNIDHLISTKWGQRSPWNVSAPYTNQNMDSHCPTGCGPVAVSQMLYYLHYQINKPLKAFTISSCDAFIPNGQEYIILDSTNTSFNNPTISAWSQMPLDSLSTSNAYLVSNLMLWSGFHMAAKYKVSSTSTLDTSISTAFSDAGISCTMSSCDFDTVHDRIKLYSQPCILIIRCNEGGHAVIADGFKRIINYYHHRWVRYDTQGNHQFKEENSRVLVNNFAAINWGWDGNGDSNNNSTIWYRVGQSWSVNGHNFNIFQSMVYNFS